MNLSLNLDFIDFCIGLSFFAQGDFDHDRKVVADFIKVMLRMWAQELNAREDEAKNSVKGRTCRIYFLRSVKRIAPAKFKHHIECPRRQSKKTTHI